VSELARFLIVLAISVGSAASNAALYGLAG